MQQFSSHDIAEIKSRIDQLQEMLVGRDDGQPTADRGSARPAGDARGDELDLIEQISFKIQIRRIRKSHFGHTPMSGASWDMMLDLMLAREHGRLLSASDLATGAGVPLSSGLRMIAAFEQQGLVRRAIDEKDRRRSIVRLTDTGADAMKSYFEKIGHVWRERRRRAM